MSDTPRLTGSRAIVTGATNGFGTAIVRTFVKEGAGVFAVDQPGSGIESMYQSMHGVTPCAASVTDETTAADIIARASDEFDGLDIVVNNSAVQTSKPIGDNDETELEQFLGGKILVYEAMSRLALYSLEKSPGGRIINLGCNRSAFTRAGDAAYARSQSVPSARF